MTPNELRAALKQGIEGLKEVEDRVFDFHGVYSMYYLSTDKEGFICLCAQNYGTLVKANPKLNTEKVVALFYYQMTVKVSK